MNIGSGESIAVFSRSKRIVPVSFIDYAIQISSNVKVRHAVIAHLPWRTLLFTVSRAAGAAR